MTDRRPALALLLALVAFSPACGAGLSAPRFAALNGPRNVVLETDLSRRVAAPDTAQPKKPSRIVVETTKGTLVFETFPNEAPKTVAHIVALVQRGFYDSQRVHRALPVFLVQFGDPQTRDSAKRELWGRGAAASSGTPIGVAEISKKRLHKAGAVGVAHMGDPAKADSQIYITLVPRPDLDGQYAVFGQVVEGQDVPAKLQVGDEIRRVYLRE